MFELLKIAIQLSIGFILTNVVGKKIALSYQKKSSIEQMKMKRAEAEVDSIQNIILSLITSSSERRFAAIDLISVLTDKNKVENKEKISKLREENKKKVNDWNVNLGVLNMKMFNLDLYDESRYLEYTVHDEFRKAHMKIRDYFKDEKIENLKKATDHLENAYYYTRKISNKLSLISKERWVVITSDNTEPLSLYNINRASNWLLLKALFHSSKDRLRVPRP